MIQTGQSYQSALTSLKSFTGSSDSGVRDQVPVLGLKIL